MQDSEELEGTISLGGGELRSVDFLATKMAEFQKLHPKVAFDFQTITSDIIKDQMDKGLMDIGLLLEQIEIDRYNYFRLSVKENWCAMIPAESKLAKKKQSPHQIYGMKNSSFQDDALLKTSFLPG